MGRDTHRVMPHPDGWQGKRDGANAPRSWAQQRLKSKGKPVISAGTKALSCRSTVRTARSSAQTATATIRVRPKTRGRRMYEHVENLKK